MCLFLAVLGLRCCAWFSLVGTSRGYSSLWSTDFSCGGFFFFSFKILFLIEDKFHYNVVLVSVIHQHESAISVHMYSPSWTSLPPHSSCPSRLSQITKLGSLCYTAAFHWLFHRQLCIYVNTTFSIRPTLSFPRCVKFFLYICVSIPALQIGSCGGFLCCGAPALGCVGFSSCGAWV